MSEKYTPDLSAETPEPENDGQKIIIPPETMEELRAPETRAAAQEMLEYGDAYVEELKRDGLYHP